jgi:hypothetical protein
MAIVFGFAGGAKDCHALCHDQQRFATLLATVRPERCPHCGEPDSCTLWGSYLRWVYLTTERYPVRIEQVRCVMCGASHALLPSCLHLYRRYALALIQQAIIGALETGAWGDRLADALAPYHQPAVTTLHEWVRSFLHGAQLLLAWLQPILATQAPLACLDPGRQPAYLAYRRPSARHCALSHAWLCLRLAEALYAAHRSGHPHLVFHFDALFAFLTLALQTAGRMPRLVWRTPPSRAPTCQPIWSPAVQPAGGQFPPEPTQLWLKSGAHPCYTGLNLPNRRDPMPETSQPHPTAIATPPNDAWRTEVALLRYALILPLLRHDRRGDSSKLSLRAAMAAAHHAIPHSLRHTVSIPTLRRWEKVYRANAFEALKPKRRTDRGATASRLAPSQPACRRFERSHVGDQWQSDTLDGPLLCPIRPTPDRLPWPTTTTCLSR